MKKLSHLHLSLFLLGIPLAFSSSKNSSEAIQHDTRLNPLLAKINTVCKFKGEVDFYPVQIIQGNKKLSSKNMIMNICQVIKEEDQTFLKNIFTINKVPSFLAVLTVMDGTLFFPYYFDNITYISKNSSVTIENSCQSSVFSLRDNKIQSALGAYNLGGKGWFNEKSFIPNWKKEWVNGNLIFLLSYNDMLFRILHIKNANKTINQTHSDKWHSSRTKKISTSAVTTAALIALLYGLNGLISDETDSILVAERKNYNSNDNFDYNQKKKKSETTHLSHEGKQKSEIPSSVDSSCPSMPSKIQPGSFPMKFINSKPATPQSPFPDGFSSFPEFSFPNISVDTKGEENQKSEIPYSVNSTTPSMPSQIHPGSFPMKFINSKPATPQSPFPDGISFPPGFFFPNISVDTKGEENQKSEIPSSVDSTSPSMPSKIHPGSFPMKFINSKPATPQSPFPDGFSFPPGFCFPSISVDTKQKQTE